MAPTYPFRTSRRLKSKVFSATRAFISSDVACQAERNHRRWPRNFSQVRCRGTKRRDGWARRRSSCKAQQIACEISPESLIRPSPNKAAIKRKVDGGVAMKGTWAAEKGSRRTGLAMKVDAQGHKCSIMRSDLRSEYLLQEKVADARLRGGVQGQEVTA